MEYPSGFSHEDYMAKDNMLYYDMAREYIDTCHVFQNQRTIILAGGGFWVWDHTKYNLWRQRDLENHVLRWMQLNNVSSARATQQAVAANVEAILSDVDPGLPPKWVLPQGANEYAERHHHWIAFKNGLLDITPYIDPDQTRPRPKGVVCPHNPRWFSPVVLPYPYDPDAACPLFTQCLQDWMRGDASAIALLQEFVGYCLVPDTTLQTALCLEGNGANGKSTFVDAVTAMLGDDNVSAVALEHFNSEYALSSTIGKLLNTSTETDPGKRIPVETLKKYIAGDLITTNKKYKDHITFRPSARLMVLWNERPQVRDISNGFWRRVKLVPFTREYGPGTMDPLLPAKLRSEAPGIFNWAIEGLQRLRAQGSFTRCAASDHCVAEFRAAADPIRSFLQSSLCVDPDGNVSKADLYSAYMAACAANSSSPAPMEIFSKAVHRVFPGVGSARLRSGAGRVYAFTGIAWSTGEATPLERSGA